ncbi:MAG TPA: hypothetical protein VHZ55_05045 [Bryobacteraceae bacterium]|nr:hypothetical protein [Bryobacteraceae bacterium]
MKRYTRKLLVSAIAMAMLYVGGCKHEPNPPTEQDAIAVWNNINKRPPLPNEAELISFKKTNGQSQEVNGAKMYMLYYTATKKTRVKVGIHPPGFVETWSGNYPFQWTEKGWMGPDDEVYPEH